MPENSLLAYLVRFLTSGAGPLLEIDQDRDTCRISGKETWISAGMVEGLTQGTSPRKGVQLIYVRLHTAIAAAAAAATANATAILFQGQLEKTPHVWKPTGMEVQGFSFFLFFFPRV